MNDILAIFKELSYYNITLKNDFTEDLSRNLSNQELIDH